MNNAQVAQLASSIKEAFVNALPADLSMDIRNSISATYTPLCDSMAQAILVFTNVAIGEAVATATSAAKTYTDTKLADHTTNQHAPDPNAGTIPSHTHTVTIPIGGHAILALLSRIGQHIPIVVPVNGPNGNDIGEGSFTLLDVWQSIVQEHGIEQFLQLQGEAQ